MDGNKKLHVKQTSDFGISGMALERVQRRQLDKRVPGSPKKAREDPVENENVKDKDFSVHGQAIYINFPQVGVFALKPSDPTSPTSPARLGRKSKIHNSKPPGPFATSRNRRKERPEKPKKPEKPEKSGGGEWKWRGEWDGLGESGDFYIFGWGKNGGDVPRLEVGGGA
ncbi:hypothetical protein V497_02556 [Pseudogymnoascus sp. VKM F-4516 (FW-969)]|nr:hypothetical protein V497_02556 [Pseudogymnoascus sp. VKM F-4516 (FW-969)]